VTSLTDALLLVAAGLGAGTINGVAGGGTLVSFPALLAVGVPAIQANVTSTIGIWPSYLGGVAGFRAEIREQRESRWLIWPAGAGALAGAVLLLTTPASLFKSMAPYLVLAACGLFAAQPLVAARVSRTAEHDTPRSRTIAAVGTLLGAVYGGYFGAGLGVILLALLGVTLPDDLVRTNGLRAMLSLAVNTVAALVFVIAAHVVWRDAGLLVGSSLVGGYLGARLARRLPPVVFRVVVLTLGLATSIRLLA
jgi:uncharacterized membrane protein YfcA